jgi:hypothetical protein
LAKNLNSQIYGGIPSRDLVRIKQSGFVQEVASEKIMYKKSTPSTFISLLLDFELVGVHERNWFSE